MKGPVLLWLVLLAGAIPPAYALGEPTLGPGGTLGTGDTHYVEVVRSEGMGPVAGLVARTSSGFLGLGIGATSAPLQGGYVVLHAPSTEVHDGMRLVVQEDVPFSDPNGATWLGRHAATETGAALWVVPVGPLMHDDTLDADYNFAVVVDWDEVGGEGLVATHLQHVEIA